ncbi:hypothetical protein NDU88_006423 [Pleurodeles waltl]|uniref:Uncharacterized protein n=1 Tax=Pleurodeles waltl TaxID=8319 RepID=A0AAV7WEE2_PLEWA|nr:hypothetical protein NDU88_006423 [Pleurodeles waltl]
MFSNAMTFKQTPPQREALDTQSRAMGADGEQVSAVSVSSAGARGTASSETAVQDNMALLVKNWEGRVGAKELEVCESIEMAQTVLLSAGPQAQHYMVLYNLYYTPAKIASWGRMLVLPARDAEA